MELFFHSEGAVGLPDGIFADLQDLEYLIVKGADSIDLRQGSFTGLSGLRTINMDETSIGALPAGAFDDLGELKVMNIRSDTSGELPAGLFDRLNSLTHLGIVMENLRVIPPDLFDKLTDLNTLGVSAAGFGTNDGGLHRKSFVNLPSLRHLNLHDASGHYTWNHRFPIEVANEDVRGRLSGAGWDVVAADEIYIDISE